MQSSNHNVCIPDTRSDLRKGARQDVGRLIYLRFEYQGRRGKLGQLVGSSPRAYTGPEGEQSGCVLGLFRFLVNESLFGASSAIAPQIVLEVAEGTVVLQPLVGVQTEGEGVTRQIVAGSDGESFEAEPGRRRSLLSYSTSMGLHSMTMTRLNSPSRLLMDQVR